jgi:hypothetical protein
MTTESIEIEELEEQLILLYRFVSQINTLKRFYYSGMDYKPVFEDDTGILTELVENEESEEILKTCILEIEEGKGNKDMKFHEVLDSYDVEELYNKYELQDVVEVNKLDLKKIVDSL